MGLGMTDLFSPKPGVATVVVTVAASSAAAALGVTTDSRTTLRLAAPADNTGPVFVTFGGSGATATTTSMPILPGATEPFYPPAGTTHIATIGTASDTLYVTVGEGE